MINQRAEAVIDSNNDHHVQSVRHTTIHIADDFMWYTHGKLTRVVYEPQAISEREAKAAFARIDTDRSGTLDLMEFKVSR